MQAERTLHGLHPIEDKEEKVDHGPWYQNMNDIAEQAKRRAEIARYTFRFLFSLVLTSIIHRTCQVFLECVKSSQVLDPYLM